MACYETPGNSSGQTLSQREKSIGTKFVVILNGIGKVGNDIFPLYFLCKMPTWEISLTNANVSVLSIKIFFMIRSQLLFQPEG